MSYSSLLINTCNIWRFTPGVADAYGNPAKAWVNILPDEPCRIMPAGMGNQPSGREIRVGAEVVIAHYKLFLGDVGITEQDRVTIGAITYEVLMVEDKQDAIGSHHKECWMNTVR